MSSAPSVVMARLGAELRRLRKAQRLTLNEVCRISSNDPSNLSRVERGAGGHLSVTSLYGLARALDTTTFHLLQVAEDGLSPEEAEILASFRSSEQHGRMLIITAARIAKRAE